MLIGYARVSKADGSQGLDLQRDALIGAGVDGARLYVDHASGKRDDRPGLTACLTRSSQATRLLSGSSTGLNAISPTSSPQCAALTRMGSGSAFLPGTALRSTLELRVGCSSSESSPPSPSLSATLFGSASWLGSPLHGREDGAVAHRTKYPSEAPPGSGSHGKTGNQREGALQRTRRLQPDPLSPRVA